MSGNFYILIVCDGVWGGAVNGLYTQLWCYRYTLHNSCTSCEFVVWKVRPDSTTIVCTPSGMFHSNFSCWSMLYICAVRCGVGKASVLRSKAHIRTRELSNGSSVTKVRDDGAGRSGAQTVRCYCLLSTEMEQGSRTEHTAITQNTHHIRVHIMLA